MRVFVEIEHVDIIELDVEILVDGFQGPADTDVIFELDRDGLVGEGLEETRYRVKLSYLLVVVNRRWS